MPQRLGAAVPENPTQEELEARLREAMRQHRQKLYRAASVGSRGKSDLATRRRFAQEKTRRKFGIAYGKQARPPKELLSWRFRRSSLMDGLVPDREQSWLPILARDASKQHSLSVKDFSLVDNPVGTMTMLREMAALEGVASRAYLHFED